MDFQPVKASDKEIIDKYMKKANSRSCDMSFAAVYLWKDFYLLEYTVCEDMLIFRTTEDGSSYSFPIGDASPEKALLALEAHCKENEEPLKLHCVYRENEAWLLVQREWYSGKKSMSFSSNVIKPSLRAIPAAQETKPFDTDHILRRAFVLRR